MALSSELTLSLPRCRLKSTDKSAKFEILTHLSYFTLVCEKISIKMHNIVNRFGIGPKSVLYASVCALFSPEILQAVAVEGLRTAHRRYNSGIQTIPAQHRTVEGK